MASFLPRPPLPLMREMAQGSTISKHWKAFENELHAIHIFLPAATACRRPTSRFSSPPPSSSPKFKKFKNSADMTLLEQYNGVRNEKLEILMLSAVCLLSADCFGSFKDTNVLQIWMPLPPDIWRWVGTIVQIECHYRQIFCGWGHTTANRGNLTQRLRYLALRIKMLKCRRPLRDFSSCLSIRILLSASLLYR